MTSHELQQARLWNNLTRLGQSVKLNVAINESEILQQLVQFDNNWCPYNQIKDLKNNRWGLPITSFSGDVDDNYHLNSFGYMQRYHDQTLHESDFVTPTSVYYSIPELKRVIDLFLPDIGRVHLLRVDRGGFFPPHRDFHGLAPEYFRIMCVFGNCSDSDFVHMLDGQRCITERANLYFVNFQLPHSVFSFTDKLYNLILTVRLNQRTHDIVLEIANNADSR